MTTLKQHLENAGLEVNQDDRFILGKKIASIFDCQKQGTHHKIKEDDHLVMNYESKFLQQKCITKVIIKWLKNH